MHRSGLADGVTIGTESVISVGCMASESAGAIERTKVVETGGQADQHAYLHVLGHIFQKLDLPVEGAADIIRLPWAGPKHGPRMEITHLRRWRFNRRLERSLVRRSLYTNADHRWGVKAGTGVAGGLFLPSA